jgi:hypothetical protein
VNGQLLIHLTLVIPAKAGIPLFFADPAQLSGAPAFAGVTNEVVNGGMSASS